MGELNAVPMRINVVEGAGWQVKLSGGVGVIETWGAPAPAAHVHAAGDVTSGQFPLARMPRAATGNFLEGNGVGADPIYNALIATNIPNLAASKITSGQFPLARMPRGAAGDVITGTGVGSDPVYATPAGVVSGLIVMWHGTIANIPAGFVICDGNNSTPNLLTRFVQGVATAGTNPGATGGATAKTTSGHQHDESFELNATEMKIEGADPHGQGGGFTRAQSASFTSDSVLSNSLLSIST